MVAYALMISRNGDEEEDLKEAYKLFYDAARQNNKDAMFNQAV